MRNANVMITISRQGFDTLRLSFDNEPTKDEILEKADWTLSSGEKFVVNGEEAGDGAVFEDGDTIQVVGKKEGGLK